MKASAGASVATDIWSGRRTKVSLITMTTPSDSDGCLKKCTLEFEEIIQISRYVRSGASLFEYMGQLLHRLIADIRSVI